MIFIRVGVKFAERISQKTFDRYLPLMFVVIEIKLIYDVVVSFRAAG